MASGHRGRLALLEHPRRKGRVEEGIGWPLTSAVSARLRSASVGGPECRGKLEHTDRLFTVDRREVLQELAQALPGLQIVDERPHWHPCAAEDGRAAEDLVRSLISSAGECTGLAMEHSLREWSHAVLTSTWLQAAGVTSAGGNVRR